MKKFIGYEEALKLTLDHVGPIGSEMVELHHLTGRILAADLAARVDSPSINASLKDGYAVCSRDLSQASPEHPVTLSLTGSVSAGNSSKFSVSPGQAVRITTGASLPDGADAVLSEEFTVLKDNHVICSNTADPGRNILPRGTDIRRGETVAVKLEKITPALTGLMATAGLEKAEVYKLPGVAVIATGDEVVAPGQPLPDGMLYASNLVEICSWLTHHQITCRVDMARDRQADIIRAISEALPHVDAVITSGGIWGSERDLLAGVLNDLGWQGIYHRVRIGPGKAIAFGLLQGKPFFCLPGGPPSNEMAFLQLTLPGLLKMKGEPAMPFPTAAALLTETVRGDREWTQFIHARVERRGRDLLVTPFKPASRLQSMARKTALIKIPEGTEELPAGALAEIQLLQGM
ncbi:MAG: molybdopterin molybdotransferase MoeA [Thermodesulfobacteriota bacterium]